MDKIIGFGKRLRNAIASEGHDEDQTAAAAPPPPAINTRGYTIRGNDPLSQQVATGLNKWLSGGFSGPGAPGVRGW